MKHGFAEIALVAVIALTGTGCARLAEWRIGIERRPEPEQPAPEPEQPQPEPPPAPVPPPAPEPEPVPPPPPEPDPNAIYVGGEMAVLNVPAEGREFSVRGDGVLSWQTTAPWITVDAAGRVNVAQNETPFPRLNSIEGVRQNNTVQLAIIQEAE